MAHSLRQLTTQWRASSAAGKVLVKLLIGGQTYPIHSFPAGTTYMGIVWVPWAWEMVKKGKISGLSMGGW